jgi:hypothetical protein
VSEAMHCMRRTRTLTYFQRRTDNRRMGQPTRRPGILDPARRLPTQAIIRNRWFGINIHLRVLRRELEGGHG